MNKAGTITKIDRAWMFFPNWLNPVAGSQDSLSGQGDTCGAGTSPTGDRNWKGTAVEWNTGTPLARARATVPCPAWQITAAQRGIVFA